MDDVEAGPEEELLETSLQRCQMCSGTCQLWSTDAYVFVEEDSVEDDGNGYVAEADVRSVELKNDQLKCQKEKKKTGN